MGITFESYLEDPTFDVFVSSSIVRKDAICRIQSATSEEHLAFMEWKFRQSISPTVASEAIYTTSYGSVYTTKDRQPRAGHANKRQKTMGINSSHNFSPIFLTSKEIIETKYNAKNGCLRIVFLYPEAPRGVGPYLEGNDVVIILDKRYLIVVVFAYMLIL